MTQFTLTIDCSSFGEDIDDVATEIAYCIQNVIGHYNVGDYGDPKDSSYFLGVSSNGKRVGTAEIKFA